MLEPGTQNLEPCRASATEYREITTLDIFLTSLMLEQDTPPIAVSNYVRKFSFISFPYKMRGVGYLRNDGLFGTIGVMRNNRTQKRRNHSTILKLSDLSNS